MPAVAGTEGLEARRHFQRTHIRTPGLLPPWQFWGLLLCHRCFHASGILWRPAPSLLGLNMQGRGLFHAESSPKEVSHELHAR